MAGEGNPMFGKSHDEETRELMRYAKKLNPPIGDKNSMFGRKHTEETKKLQREIAKLRHIIYVTCLCCKYKFDIGNYTRHINKISILGVS